VQEGDRLAGQAREVRGVDDRVGVRGEQVPVEAVEHEDDGAPAVLRGEEGVRELRRSLARPPRCHEKFPS
jgi:hypothetical protein